jgi:hypothetical protein
VHCTIDDQGKRLISVGADQFGGEWQDRQLKEEQQVQPYKSASPVPKEMEHHVLLYPVVPGQHKANRVDDKLVLDLSQKGLFGGICGWDWRLANRERAPRDSEQQSLMFVWAAGCCSGFDALSSVGAMRSARSSLRRGEPRRMKGRRSLIESAVK